jgi:hypothetical protein
MSRLTLTPEELLAGANMTFELFIPPDILQPGRRDMLEDVSHDKDLMVQLRPLTIGTFQLIMKAAKEDAGLIPLLMIKEALIEPLLSLDQLRQLHLGLIEFLVANIRRISGLTQKKKSMLM